MKIGHVSMYTRGKNETRRGNEKCEKCRCVACFAWLDSETRRGKYESRRAGACDQESGQSIDMDFDYGAI